MVDMFLVWYQFGRTDEEKDDKRVKIKSVLGSNLRIIVGKAEPRLIYHSVYDLFDYKEKGHELGGL
jgi:exopolyphosphatase/pppGpp-phosphohydrolase